MRRPEYPGLSVGKVGQGIPGRGLSAVISTGVTPSVVIPLGMILYLALNPNPRRLCHQFSKITAGGKAAIQLADIRGRVSFHASFLYSGKKGIEKRIFTLQKTIYGNFQFTPLSTLAYSCEHDGG